MILPRRTPQDNGVVRMACTTQSRFHVHQWWFMFWSDQFLFALVIWLMMLPRRTPQSNGVVRTACNIILLDALNLHMLLPRRTPQNNGVERMACTTIYHQWSFEAWRVCLHSFLEGRCYRDAPRKTTALYARHASLHSLYIHFIETLYF